MRLPKMALWVFLALSLSMLSAAPFVRTIHAQDSVNGARTIAVKLKSFNMQLSPDGKTIALAADPLIYDDEVQPDLLTIHLIDVSSGQEIGQLSGPQTDFTSALAFSPDGKTLATVHQNGVILLWQIMISADKLNARSSIPEAIQIPDFAARRAKFTPDGKRLVVVLTGNPSSFLLLDVSTKEMSFIAQPFKTYADLKKSFNFPAMGDLSYSAFDLSPDGKLIATATLNDQVDLWDIASGQATALRIPKEKQTLVDIRLMVFTSDGKSLLYFDQSDQKLHMWDIVSRAEKTLTISGGAGFAPDPTGQKVAWIDKGKQAIYLAALQGNQTAEPIMLTNLAPELKTQPYTYLQFTSDGSQLIVGGLFASDGNNLIYVIPISDKK